MSEHTGAEPTDPAESREATVEVLQAVYDRVNSYEESAPPETIRRELDEALAQAGLDLDVDVRNRFVEHIDARGGREDVATLV